MYKNIDKIMHWVLLGVMALLFLLLLTGCAAKSEVVSNTANAAKETIAISVKNNPGCGEVGTVATKQINVLEENCQSEIKKISKDEWNNGLRVGIFGTLLVLFGLGFVLRRFN